MGIMCSDKSVKARNQLHHEHSPHNPALSITDEGLQVRPRIEANVDNCCRCRSDTALHLVAKRPCLKWPAPKDGLLLVARTLH